MTNNQSERATRNVQSFLNDMLRENDIDPETHHVTDVEIEDGELTVTTDEYVTTRAYRAMASAILGAGSDDYCEVSHQGITAAVYDDGPDGPRVVETETPDGERRIIELTDDLRALVFAASEI